MDAGFAAGWEEDPGSAFAPVYRRETRTPASRASRGKSRIALRCSACIRVRAARATTGARARKEKRAKGAVYSRRATSERRDGFKGVDRLFRRGAVARAAEISGARGREYPGQVRIGAAINRRDRPPERGREMREAGIHPYNRDSPTEQHGQAIERLKRGDLGAVEFLRDAIASLALLVASPGQHTSEPPSRKYSAN